MRRLCDWFTTEWKLTPLRWQIFLILLALFSVWRTIFIVLPAFSTGDVEQVGYLSSHGVFVPVLILILPFVIATKARKRGRRFGLWLILAMVFNPIVIGIVYWIVVRKEIERPTPDDSTVASFETSADNQRS